MAEHKKLWLLGASVGLTLSLAAYFMAPAFSPALLFSFISVPWAIFCGYMGAARTALVAAYFGVVAWLPLWLPRRSSLSYDEVYLYTLAGGVALIIAAAFWGRVNRGAD